MSLEASVRLAGIGVSVIDACPRELLYLTVGDIALEYLREGQVWQEESSVLWYVGMLNDSQGRALVAVLGLCNL